MKKLLASASFAALLALSGNAFAFEIGGSTGNFCNVQFTGAVPNLSGLFSNGYIQTTAQSATVANVSCNARAAVTVESARNGLKPSSSATCTTGSFADCVQYQAGVSWTSAAWDPSFPAPAYLTTGAAGPVTVVGKTTAQHTDPLSLTITPQADSRQVLPGAYADTITIGVAIY